MQYLPILQTEAWLVVLLGFLAGNLSILRGYRTHHLPHRYILYAKGASCYLATVFLFLGLVHIIDGTASLTLMFGALVGVFLSVVFREWVTTTPSLLERRGNAAKP